MEGHDNFQCLMPRESCSGRLYDFEVMFDIPIL